MQAMINSLIRQGTITPKTSIAICQNLVYREGFSLPIPCGHIISVDKAKLRGWACPKCNKELDKKIDKEQWKLTRASTFLNQEVSNVG